MTTLAVLRKARNLIAKGWTQGPMKEKVGRKTFYCLYGALTEVGALATYSAEELCQDRYLSSRRRASYSSASCLIAYNETKGRTQKQILNLFDRTITRLKKEKARA